jgi:hypothetical protein
MNTYDIEALYAQCRTDPQLRLPVSMSHGGLLGVDASLAQLVITWAKAHPRGTLHLYSDTESAFEHVSQLAKTAAGLAALVMSTEIESETHDPIDRRAALSVIRPLIEAMFESKLKETSGGKGARPKVINLFSINHAQMEYIKPFYYGEKEPEVHKWPTFSTLIEDLSSVMHTKHERNALMRSGLSALGTVLEELISNADEHASHDLKGDKYKKGLRGMTVKASRISKKDIKNYSHTEPEFARFVIKHMVKDVDALDFLEISIIDSGPGLARRWLSMKEGAPLESLEKLTLEEELRATLDCFKKHVTTKPSKESGMGLHNAVQAFNKLQAYVRLRTGRLCLSQAFQGHEGEVAYHPKKWSGGGELDAAEGTVFTICIPVN